MDLQDIWQQNKSWILGVVAGIVLFFVGKTVVNTFWDAPSAEKGVRSAVSKLGAKELYQAAESAEIAEEAERLRAAEDDVRKAIEYHPSERFLLQGKGDPDTYLDRMNREVRQAVLGAAQRSGVDFADRALVAPIGAEEVGRALLGLEVLESAAMRFVEAGDEVRNLDPESLGLSSVTKFSIESQRKTTARGRSPRSKSSVKDRIDEVVVEFDVRCDFRTLRTFLEKCQALEPRLVLKVGLTVKPGGQAGDPLTVQGSVAGLMIRADTEETP